jgi:hypothetical protein
MRDHSTDQEKTPDPRRTAIIAYEFWRARGCPEGSPEQDWFLAEEQLRHQEDFRHQRAA